MFNFRNLMQVLHLCSCQLLECCQATCVSKNGPWRRTQNASCPVREVESCSTRLVTWDIWFTQMLIEIARKRNEKGHQQRNHTVQICMKHYGLYEVDIIISLGSGLDSFSICFSFLHPSHQFIFTTTWWSCLKCEIKTGQGNWIRFVDEGEFESLVQVLKALLICEKELSVNYHRVQEWVVGSGGIQIN